MPSFRFFVLLPVAALVFQATMARAQTVDITIKKAAPDSALLTPAMIDAGRKVFHGPGNCYACHGGKLEGGPIAPALTGKSWRHVNGDFDAIVDRIDNGLTGTLMVPHPGGISESQVFLVAAYIYSVSHGLAKP
ncbi:MAG: c-type cytochrome [Gemmatimonadota bacterium]